VGAMGIVADFAKAFNRQDVRALVAGRSSSGA
jgi:hypothetical protein